MMGKKFSISIACAFLCAAIVWGFTAMGPRDNDPRSKDQNLVRGIQKNRDAGINNLQVNTDNNNPNPHYTQSVIFESFEGATFPPSGWSKLNPDGGTGWEQQSDGTTPIPGWVGGVITVPPGGGSKVAFCTWTTGGAVGNDQYLVTPQLTNIQANDSLKFWLRYWPDSYRDSLEVLISTTTPTVGAFTTVVMRKNFAAGSGDTLWTEYKYKIGGLVPNGSNIYIAFRETVDDNLADGSSFSIDLVSTTGIGLTNDIATTANNGPSGSVLLPTATIAPKATFMNVGSANQTNIPVTYSITGPVNYSSNKTISSLNSSGSTTVTFDSTFNPTPGSYNITIYCSLGSDQNRGNDTIKTTLTVSNPNYGGNGGYFFANSLPAGAPSNPQACAFDTTGCTFLVLNGVGTPTVGSLDDGYFKFKLPNAYKVRYYGIDYDSIRVGTNGIIAFKDFTPGGGNWSPPSTGIPGGTVTGAMYPLWTDMNFSTVDNPNNFIKYKVVPVSATTASLYIFYCGPRYGIVGDVVYFWVCISLSTSPSANSGAIFEYPGAAEGQGAGFITAYNSNSLATHLVGMQDAAGVNAVQYRFKNTGIVTPGPLFGASNTMLAVQFGPNASALDYKCQTLSLKSRLEAIGNTRRDTLTVALRYNVSPYPVIETEKVVYDSVTGNSSASFSLAGNGGNYVLQVMHRNSVSTWSASNVPCAAYAMNYDFTTNVCQAYGCNQTTINVAGAISSAAFFTGEVIRDGCVDLSDISAIYNDAAVFTGGPYVLTDLNFDEFVDLTDITYAFNNSSIFVCEQAPPAPIVNPGKNNSDVKRIIQSNESPKVISVEKSKTSYIER